MAVKSEGHVAVSTETSRYISFSESLLRYVLQLHALLSLHTHSERERENKVSYDLVTVLRYGGFDVSCFANLIVGVQKAARAPFVLPCFRCSRQCRVNICIGDEGVLVHESRLRTKIFPVNRQEHLAPTVGPI